MTGDSIPYEKPTGTEIYGNSLVSRGVCITHFIVKIITIIITNIITIKIILAKQEAVCVVHATNTLFGKCTVLCVSSYKLSHHQLVSRTVGRFCTLFIVLWVVVELIVQFGVRGKSCPTTGGKCSSLSNVVVLIVGGIHGVMPTVCICSLLFHWQKTKKNRIRVLFPSQANVFLVVYKANKYIDNPNCLKY
jgi:hypothetical protein